MTRPSRSTPALPGASSRTQPAVTSGAHDFLIHVAVPEVDSVYAFVIDRLTERRELADAQTTMVYEHVQSRSIEPSGPAPGRSTSGR
ncbi:Lrp/AsnC ligand binding domain-containing protein [Streptomyces kunmingensis]|uniref:Lrp/AsnC ligand binding domain-containing protein n=1 Tax=Streptomyces kunmingensis TaxID=68225 RepID=A0ABU6CKI7_9ACTN|nr:Lrp/AsnC ligand binding domain-containing protein [Streptomyces kunmingensis]MEB3964400.1 Lrp/AsnC ligand binding domain-containing protein [Streptomyces kunmingensis]